MRERFLITVAIFLLNSCPAWPGAPLDAASQAEGAIIETDGDGGDYFVYSSVENPGSNLYFVVSPNDTLTIGRSGEAVERGVGARFSALESLVSDGSTMVIANPPEGGSGTVFAVSALDFANAATLVVESGSDPAATGRNRVVITTKLNGTTTSFGSDNRLIVNDHADVEILHRDYKSNVFTFELAGGRMSFADSLTMQAGAIEATAGSSTLAVAGGLTLNQNDPRYTVAPVVRVRSGSELTLVRELGGSEAADLTFGEQAGLDIQGGGVLTAGAVRFTQSHVLDAAQAGTVNAKRLEFSSLVDAAGLAWHVGEAAFTGNYTVKGTGNTYGSVEMSAGAVLASDDAADTTITLGTEDAPGEITVNGGSVRAGAGHNFAVKNARLVLTAAAPGAVLDAGAGGLDLSESAVLVDAAAPDAVMTFDAAAGITLGEYEQAAGTVAVNGATRGFAVTGSAVIGGHAAPAKFTASGDATDFRGGLALRENGVLAAGDGGGTVNLGGGLALSGGAVLDGGADGLTFVAAGTGGEGEADPALRVTGLGNIVRGAVATDLRLLVNSPGMALGLDGGVLEVGSATVERGGVYATGAGGTIRSGGGGVFTVAKDGALETTSAGLSIEGYDAVVIDGTYTAGWDGAGVAALTVDSDLRLGPAAAIRFTDELLANITPGPEAAIIKLSGSGKTIKTEGDLSIKSIFGSVGMTATGGTLAVTSIANRIKGDFSPEDIALAADNMRGVWGEEQISSELAGLAYAAAVPAREDSGFPAAADAAGRNAALLRGLANPSGVTVGQDTLEYMNGAAAAKVSLAGLAAAMAVHEQVSGRVRELRGALQNSDTGIAADEALPAAAVDTPAPGGAYFAGLRVWDRQDDGDGFSGYEYDAHGFLMGYDRALADNIALGASFAYYRGDYRDGGALSSASGIDGYGLSVYGVYNRDDGVFAAATAGYARFDNDIRELRSDPSSPAGASWAGAQYDSGVLTLAVDAGFDYNPADYLTLTPSMGLLYLHSSADDHDAFLSGVATQRERDVSSEALLFPFRLAGRYETRLGLEGRLVLTASLGYTFNAMRRGHSGVIDYYGLSASAPGMGRASPRHSVNAGFGVRFVYRCFDFGLDYSFAGGGGYGSHRLAGSVGATF